MSENSAVEVRSLFLRMRVMRAPADRPNAPALEVESATASALTVRWTSPPANAAIISGYAVEIAFDALFYYSYVDPNQSSVPARTYSDLRCARTPVLNGDAVVAARRPATTFYVRARTLSNLRPQDVSSSFGGVSCLVALE